MEHMSELQLVLLSAAGAVLGYYGIGILFGGVRVFRTPQDEYDRDRRQARECRADACARDRFWHNVKQRARDRTRP